MSTYSIGPCNCCTACGCSSCLWRWIYFEATMSYQWSIIDGCGGGSGSSEPCCGCPSPPRMGEYEDEEYQINCVLGGNINRCSCTQCSFWWDAFLVEWVPLTGCTDQYGTVVGSGTCTCSSDGLAPGTTHNENSGPQPCGCPTI